MSGKNDNLSSDAGLLLINEFISKLHFDKLMKSKFHTNDTAIHRDHTDDANLQQVLNQLISSYYEDDCADELTKEPIMNAILGKDRLASQPTLSRFYNRMDEDTIEQLELLTKAMYEVIYSIKRPEFILLDMDSTLLNTYGHQEGEDFNYHYQAHEILVPCSIEFLLST